MLFLMLPVGKLNPCPRVFPKGGGGKCVLSTTLSINGLYLVNAFELLLAILLFSPPPLLCDFKNPTGFFSIFRTNPLLV